MLPDPCTKKVTAPEVSFYFSLVFNLLTCCCCRRVKPLTRAWLTRWRSATLCDLPLVTCRRRSEVLTSLPVHVRPPCCHSALTPAFVFRSDVKPYLFVFCVKLKPPAAARTPVGPVYQLGSSAVCCLWRV